MQITLSRDERPILLSKLGLPAKATNEEITAAVAERLTGSPVPAAPQPAIASRPADGHDLIAAAIREDRIPASRAEHYAQRFAEDPEGTRKALARLTPGSAYFANHGGSAPQPTDYPREWLPDVHRTRGRVTHGGD